MQPYNQTNTDGYNAQPQGGGYDEDPPDWEEWDEDGGQVTSPTNVTGGATSYGRYQSDRTSSREPGDSSKQNCLLDDTIRIHTHTYIRVYTVKQTLLIMITLL